MLSLITLLLVPLALASAYEPSCSKDSETTADRQGTAIACIPACKPGYESAPMFFQSCWQTCHSVCEGKGKPLDAGLTCYCTGHFLTAKKSYFRSAVKPSCQPGDTLTDGLCRPSN